LLDKRIKAIIRNALDEDIGSGDVTSERIIPENMQLKGSLISKAEGIIAGLEVFREVLKTVDQKTRIELIVNDGDTVRPGMNLAKIFGPGRALLSAERVALNLLQRMSGIATQTNKFVKSIEGTKAAVLDTRKTVPGLRILDKLAVKTGGGRNHRFGLFDMVLIKENHIKAAGSIVNAVQQVRNKNQTELKIEVEVKNIMELKEALALKVDRILLDNMSVEQMREAVEITKGAIPLEASGNISMENIREIAETGVDYISSGMLTHSVKALDISFLIQ